MNCPIVAAVLLTAVLALAAPAFAGPPTHPVLTQAEQARARIELSREADLLKGLAESDASDDVRSEAWRRLATLQWRFYAKPEQARVYLDRAEALESGRRGALLERARMERTLGNFALAQGAAREALRLSASPDEEAAALTSLTQALTAPLFAARQASGATSTSADSNSQGLREAAGRLRGLVRGDQATLPHSRALLDAALVLDDGPVALEAWRLYYHVRTDAPPQGLMGEPARTLAEKWPVWAGHSAPDDARSAVVLALAASGMYEQAEFVALGAPEGDLRQRPKIADVLAWAGAIRSMHSVVEGYYRELALGSADSNDFRSNFEKVCRQAWGAFAWDKSPPAFSMEAFRQEVDRRFGALLNLGTTGKYYNLHLGHRVTDEHRTVKQYGRSAKVRFVALDGIVSNGFESWAWDGRSQHGGWGGASEIVQIRPAYTDNPARAWADLAGPKRRAELDQRIARESAEDKARAARDPFGYLPGLALRMRISAEDRILTKLKAGGLKGPALREAFIAEVERDSLESSIFAHEGRHAIDKSSIRDWLRTGAEREFRAKLSEIVFAPDPFMALPMGIFTAEIGAHTPHGEADLKLVKGLVEWMKSHRDQIQGLEAGSLLLPQLDRLTADQLRAAARSMDPFAEDAAP